MPLRAFFTSLVAGAAVVMLLTVGSGVAGASVAASANSVGASTAPYAAAAGTAPPVDTVNPFLPDDRGISDCVSALPKPGCGSEARGGWHQYLVLIALVGGLSIVGWRIVAGIRRGDRHAADRPRDVTQRSG